MLSKFYHLSSFPKLMPAPWWKKGFCGTESLEIFVDKQST